MMLQLAVGLLFSAGIASLALWRRALSLSGAAGAIGVGTLTFGLGGVSWGLLLLFFFVSSSLLSRYQVDRKRKAAQMFAKGNTRDLGQVLANGGPGVLLALGHAVHPSPLWFTVFVGIMATVTADTWATELGTLSRFTPRLITTFRPVEPGTSGGMSVIGTAAATAGGLAIGLLAGLFTHLEFFRMIIIGGIAGLVGALCDSLLGATVQRMSYCSSCDASTESVMHTCGRPTKPLRGWRWMDNDAVNAVASLAGGGAAVVLDLVIPI